MSSLQDCGFAPLEQDFADLMVRLAPEGGKSLYWAAAHAIRAVLQKHICCDLAQMPVPDDVPHNWQEILQRPSAVISGDGSTPLVLDHTRIYLQKMYRKEIFLAQDLRHFARKRDDFDPVRAGAILRKLFPDTPSSDRQMQAVFAAARGHLTILSGGPGTGKTYTAGKILAFLKRWYGDDLRIAGAAPTGKAAARLGESLQGIATSTLHRLLGITPFSPHPRYRRTEKLPYDVVILDEVSMVPLALLADFFAAMPENGTVILLGDQNQLCSVEPGAVFGDLCAAFAAGSFSDDFRRDFQTATGQEMPDLPRSGRDTFAVLLRESRRFPADGAIAQVSDAINTAATPEEVHCAAELLKKFPAEIDWFDLPSDWHDAQSLCRCIRQEYEVLLQAETPEKALDALLNFRILTAVHKGPHGREAMNRLAEELLHVPLLVRQKYYRGRPILIRKNAPQLHLFNGDTGILWQMPDTGNWVGCFRSADAELLMIPVELLPEYESAYAMTVHQSQGSEFERILLILPPSDFYSRELIYTGLTRTRTTLTAAGALASSEKAIRKKALRTTGLQDRLHSDT